MIITIVKFSYRCVIDHACGDHSPAISVIVPTTIIACDSNRVARTFCAFQVFNQNQ